MPLLGSARQLNHFIDEEVFRMYLLHSVLYYNNSESIQEIKVMWFLWISVYRWFARTIAGFGGLAPLFLQ